MEIVDTSAIRLDPHNYRAHNKRNKELINKSLRECGAGRSVLIDKEGALIAGNGVCEQAKKLNIPTKIIETDGSELIVVQRKDLATKDLKRKKLAAFDNSTADGVRWNVDNLAADFDLAELPKLGIEGLQVVEPEPEEIVEDEPPELGEVPTRTKPGDVWQLGTHRLLCGGSPWTKDGTKADLTLNLYARYLAKQFIKKNNWNVPVFCDIACAIGRRDIEICLHDGQGTIYKRYTERKKPQDLIKKFKLDTPIYAHLCREGLFSGI